MNTEFVKRTYENESIVEYYNDIAFNFGLFKSEKLLFQNYCSRKSNILDIGCGAGRTTIGLYKIGYTNITGVDISENMIMRAKKNAKDICFIQADVLNLPMYDESFDVAFFSFNGLMLIPEYEIRKQAVDEISRVLKPGGLFIFSTPFLDNKLNGEFWKTRLAEILDIRKAGDLLIEDNGVNNIYIHIPMLEEVIELVTSCSMKIIEKRRRIEICLEDKDIEENLDDNFYWVVKKMR